MTSLGASPLIESLASTGRPGVMVGGILAFGAGGFGAKLYGRQRDNISDLIEPVDHRG